jgi:hypothetical protein
MFNKDKGFKVGDKIKAKRNITIGHKVFGYKLNAGQLYKVTDMGPDGGWFPGRIAVNNMTCWWPQFYFRIAHPHKERIYKVEDAESKGLYIDPRSYMD